VRCGIITYVVRHSAHAVYVRWLLADDLKWNARCQSAAGRKLNSLATNYGICV